VDRTESHVREHLVKRGCSDIVYEPDGKVPPDFRVDGAIAVEARRLNQHDSTGEHGLEETRIPLTMRLSSLIRSMPSVSADTKWIGIDMRRPLPAWIEVVPKVREFLSRIDAGKSRQGSTVAIGNLELEYHTSSSSESGAFKVATILDRDWGGLVLANLLHNLDLCVAEKSRKTAAYRAGYEQWWLALVDTIGYHLEEPERQELREAFTLQHDWDQVVLINPEDPSDYVDLCGNRPT
jgi:hypothetical protein